MSLTFSRRALIGCGAAALALPHLPTLVVSARADGGASAAARGVAHTRRVGEAEVTVLLDGRFDLDPSFVINVAPETLAAAAEAAFLKTGAPIPLPVTAHLVRIGDRTILVDSGAAGVFGPTLGYVPAALTLAGVAPEDIDTVLVTHMHADHVGGLLAGGAPAYPNAAVRISAADLAFWTDETIAAGAPEMARPMFELARAVAAAYGARIETFEGEAELAPGVTAIPLPGHTVGQSGFRIDSGGEALLMFGDAANVAAVQFAHPEAGLVFDTDPAEAAATRARLFDMAAADRLLVAGCHMPFPGFGHVERQGDAYRWAPAEWQLL